VLDLQKPAELDSPSNVSSPEEKNKIINNIAGRIETMLFNEKFGDSPTCPSSEHLPEEDHFNCISHPAITLIDYLTRISDYSNCGLSTMVAAYILITRLLSYNKNFHLTSRNSHKVLLSSVVLAMKCYDDYAIDNKSFAKIGGIGIDCLNVLEMELADLLHFSLFIDENTYVHTFRSLSSGSFIPTVHFEHHF